MDEAFNTCMYIDYACLLAYVNLTLATVFVLLYMLTYLFSARFEISDIGIMPYTGTDGKAKNAIRCAIDANCTR